MRPFLNDIRVFANTFYITCLDSTYLILEKNIDLLSIFYKFVVNLRNKFDLAALLLLIAITIYKYSGIYPYEHQRKAMIIYIFTILYECIHRYSYPFQSDFSNNFKTSKRKLVLVT